MFVRSLCVHQKRFGENPSITSGAMTYRSEQGMVTFLAHHKAKLGWWHEEPGDSCLPLIFEAL